MASETVRLRGRPAHTPGTTILSYTPNGRQVITAGSNSAVRIFTIGEKDEPKTVDDGVDGRMGIVATNDSFIMGAEDGTVWKYELETGQMDKLLVRCALPVRDLSLSKDKDWVAVASDELVVKIVNIHDMTIVKYLREQSKGVKHVNFDPSGRFIAVSCSDGIIYIYSVDGPQPELVKKIDGIIGRLETDHEATSRAVWHPDARAFAAVEPTRDIAIISMSDWTKQNVFPAGHNADITALAWSPNGALLASAGADRQILLWETKTQKILRRYDVPNVINLAWHPVDNTLSFTTSDGELFIYEEFVPPEYRSLLDKPLESAPLLSGAPQEHRGIPSRPLTNGVRTALESRPRGGSPDSLDDILGPMDEDDGFIEDDDGAGYTEINQFGKRTNATRDDVDGHDDKRHMGMFLQPKRHASFQPGSTPWRGDRRYLCLNLIGFVWTVNQETHNTVTVEFYDRERFRDFHFTDPFLYDKACLNEKGALFSCQPSDGNPATIFYRPHETWTVRADWRTQLPEGESITAIALSNSYIVVTTSANYVRVYTLFGTPFRIFRQKSQSVTCAAWRDYVLTVGNGPVGSDGMATLTYSIENVKRDEICQNEDYIALPDSTELRNVFFSDSGDPYIYDSSGVLLVLQHWRKPGQARWVPLLDTKLMDRLSSGRKEETYWPVAVAQDAFHCIILKGGDRYPYFPRPLLSEFEFKIPISAKPNKGSAGDGEDEDMNDSAGHDSVNKLEEAFVRSSLFFSLLDDRVTASEAMSGSGDVELRRKEIDIDKIVLQMLAIECREGEERGMKALELVSIMRDRSGKMLDAARKVALRYDRTVLDEKIRELAERRLMGAEDDDDEDDELA
ncbi:chromosome transmission fidelity protein 4 [[Emmonsia] crescens]|uniref:Chromosome transmission fidelity protein 4 n=1 Tax=[Emmonsia] crescens TaxID=73230 RepID=A0A0G2J310_9EURO|nr:chromosome transmission fidelity protein 4 [Emmonsia crescens UAMH 3008]